MSITAYAAALPFDLSPVVSLSAASNVDSSSRRGQTRFTYEAHMLPVIAAATDDLLSGLPDPDRHTVMYEVQALESVPDMVVVQFDEGVLARRRARGVQPVTDSTSARVLMALTSGIADVDSLAGRSGISRAHLRRRVLPSLAERGWTADLAPRAVDVRVLHPFESVLTWAVTVEAKRSKWREAVSQARRHLMVANRVFIALESAHADGARQYSKELARDGIGLMSVDAGTRSASIEQMPHRRRRPEPLSQRLLGERVWGMREADETVGVTSHVFGRMLPSPLAHH